MKNDNQLSKSEIKIGVTLIVAMLIALAAYTIRNMPK